MKLSGLLIIVILFGCSKQKIVKTGPVKFDGSEKVTLTGYSDHLMEPFLSRDGNTLFFNNSNDASVNTDLHWAARVDDITFEYRGEVIGVNTLSLEGVPSMDMDGNLYFVSTRTYNQTLATIYTSTYANGAATNLGLVENISKNQAGWVNFDIEVDKTGENIYFVDGRFDQAGGPYEADIVIARKGTNGFQRLSNSSEVLKNINTDALEYAACISANNLELYFTRVAAPITSVSLPQIFVSSRNIPNEPFGLPSKIESITGFAEATTLSPDGDKLYYHKKDENNTFSLYLTRRLK